MKVSIITVCYNAESTIEFALQSVLNQDYKDIEYIVIDGASSDMTLSIIKKYEGKIAKIVSEKDNGMYYALNKGIELATGDVVGLLHADDFYASNKIISRIVTEFQSKNIDAVYGDLQYVFKEDINKVFRNWNSNPYNPSLFLKGWMPPHPTFFVKRKCYKDFGKFNTTFSISADYELMLRFLYKHNIKATYIPEVIVKMRVGGVSNISIQNRIKANMEDRRAWKINGLKPNVLTLFLKPLSKLRQYI
ncbi:MAG TPA: glycosyltransferase family 2 protein [Bacteroidia bacterium]|jgi:glycosyltransferase involved in cell wall biosynthesis|nr:glycosyltransferase family 2 protein [Bacteroidia bacterium]